MPTRNHDKAREQWKSWYEKNKDCPEYKKKIRDFDRQRRIDLAAWMEELKSTHSCVKCGFGHPAALDFHHRNPSEKLYEVSIMPRRSLSKEKILAEIAKCDVLCSNCHRILHYEERQYNKGSSSSG